MRRIKKTCNLSTEYKTQEEAWEAQNVDHPGYDSSMGRKFYLDIVMNLFHCQGGLCAYTEMPLCPSEYYEPNRWIDGHYVVANGAKKPEFKGQLDHFDPALKPKKAWLWDNFFMIDSDVNSRRMKGSKNVDSILKPDRIGYDEFKLLDYVESTHIFIANLALSKGKRKRINQMIETLGLNFGQIKADRRNFLRMIMKGIEFRITTWEDVRVDRFPTSFEIIRRKNSRAD